MDQPKQKPRRISPENSEKNSPLPYLPDELLLFNVLPRLPFKSLCVFKTVCREWRRLISSDASFAVEQSRHSSSSNVLVYLDLGGDIAFLSTAKGGPAGVPNVPSSNFLPPGYSLGRILASVSGLLCLLLECQISDSGRSCLYVLNPATRRGEIVPGSRNWVREVGLVFDPVASPAGSYKLVNPLWMAGLTVVILMVFSSDTGEWDSSWRKLDNLTSFNGCFGKSVFVGGLLYWDCFEILIWYDPERGSVGWVELPKRLPYHVVQEIGDAGGRLTCTRVSNETVEVWTRTGGGWEKTHYVRNWLRMVKGSLLGTMSLRRRSETEVRPLPFQGGERVHLRVRVKRSGWRDKVICLNMRTQKAEESGEVRFTDEVYNDWVFPYQCSIICLPRSGHNYIK